MFFTDGSKAETVCGTDFHMLSSVRKSFRLDLYKNVVWIGCTYLIIHLIFSGERVKRTLNNIAASSIVTLLWVAGHNNIVYMVIKSPIFLLGKERILKSF